MPLPCIYWKIFIIYLYETIIKQWETASVEINNISSSRRIHVCKYAYIYPTVATGLSTRVALHHQQSSEYYDMMCDAEVKSHMHLVTKHTTVFQNSISQSSHAFIWTPKEGTVALFYVEYLSVQLAMLACMCFVLAAYSGRACGLAATMLLIHTGQRPYQCYGDKTIYRKYYRGAFINVTNTHIRRYITLYTFVCIHGNQ